MAQRIFIQIGTNDGNDLFREKVIQEEPDIVILVEPNPELIPIIHNHYKNVKSNVIVLNNAIYYESGKTVELYVPAKNGQYGTIAENGHTYTHVNFSLLPMNDWGEKKDMVKIEAETLSWEHLCERYQIKKIEYLQIDTEGFDSEIIKMIDFERYKIYCLRFEKWFFDSNCFNKHNGELSESLGKNGNLEVISKLIEFGYTLEEVSDADGNDFVARLRSD
jgi:FkbM family methyltransferase